MTLSGRLCGCNCRERARSGSSTASVMNLRFWMINAVGGLFGSGVLSLAVGSVMATVSVKSL